MTPLPPTPERRRNQSTLPPSAHRKAGLSARLAAGASDILTTRDHSVDFSASRGRYIESRIRPIALILAVAMPFWLFVDYLAMTPEHFERFVPTRLVAGVLFCGIGLWRDRLPSLARARAQFAALVAVLCAFYARSYLLLDGNVAAGALIGYSYFPYMIVTMGAVFALTFLEGLAYGVPVIVVVAALDMHFGNLLTPAALQDLWLLALIAGISMWASMAQLKLLLRLYRQATRDPLTGLFNRRTLMEGLRNEIARAGRYGRPLSLMLFDLDRFKRVNDTYGHVTGDMVLQAFARMLSGELRHPDVVGRYGGEEFLAVLPETARHDARDVAERLCGACRATPITGFDGRSVAFTASVGVAELVAGEDARSVVDRVDAALYAAKAHGRDRVVVAAPSAHDS